MGMGSIIRDLDLAPEGGRKIEWVEAHMVLLNRVRERFEAEKPFSDVRIGVSLHLEAKTAYLAQVLQAGGAQLILTGSNPLSTQDDVAAALPAGGERSRARSRRHSHSLR